MENAELQASLTFIREKAETDFDGAADGIVPLLAFFSSNATTPRSLYFCNAQSSASSTLCPSARCWTNVRLAELQEQRDALEPVGQQPDVAEAVSGTDRPAGRCDPLRRLRLGHVDSTALVGRRADRDAEDPARNQSRRGRGAVQKGLQILKRSRRHRSRSGSASVEFLRDLEHRVVLALEAGPLARQAEYIRSSSMTICGCSPRVTHRTPPSHAANASGSWHTLSASVVLPNPPVP